ncbi:hypothetical protein COY07_00325 [Candidatus Peregrinibacteria bacterium CG_4_10_14_0_2_um_filter_43_11]|nr:MAG: hypothetical protein COY07_00325 [Candidatus Peregrinibacteria bacterium CG_4_10_14_0_2_um_filter_43_11]
MKKVITVFFVLFAFSLLLVGCGNTEVTPEAMENTPVVEEAAPVELTPEVTPEAMEEVTPESVQ